MIDGDDGLIQYVTLIVLCSLLLLWMTELSKTAQISLFEREKRDRKSEICRTWLERRNTRSRNDHGRTVLGGMQPGKRDPKDLLKTVRCQGDAGCRKKKRKRMKKKGREDYEKIDDEMG